MYLVMNSFSTNLHNLHVVLGFTPTYELFRKINGCLLIRYLV